MEKEYNFSQPIEHPKPDDGDDKRIPKDYGAEPKLPGENAGEIEGEKERREIAKDFAQELRNTPKGRFYRKLKRWGGIVALAGISVFEPGTGKAIAPELTREARALMEVERQKEFVRVPDDDELLKKFDPKDRPEMEKGGFWIPSFPRKVLKKLRKSDPVLFRSILKEMGKKGGVSLSPQLPELTYRQNRFAEILRDEAVTNPFYNRPEVILGTEFIQEHPEQAKKYLEKIRQTIKATVVLRSTETIGAGVFVKGKGDSVLVLTNAHIAKNPTSLTMSFVDKKGVFTETRVKMLAEDEKKDIAVLAFNMPGKDSEWAQKAHTLPLEKGVSIKDKEKIALIGHAAGFPYTVGIADAIKIPGSNTLMSYRDKRFSKLELYSPFSPKQKEIEPMFKGDPIDGMSGGPVISLEQQGDPKLAGLNSRHLYMIQSPRMWKHLEKKYFEVTGIHNFQERIEEAGYGDKNRIGKEITSDEIITFLKKNNLYEK